MKMCCETVRLTTIHNEPKQTISASDRNHEIDEDM